MVVYTLFEEARDFLEDMHSETNLGERRDSLLAQSDEREKDTLVQQEEKERLLEVARRRLELEALREKEIATARGIEEHAEALRKLKLVGSSAAADSADVKGDAAAAAEEDIDYADIDFDDGRWAEDSNPTSRYASEFFPMEVLGEGGGGSLARQFTDSTAVCMPSSGCV